MPDTENPIIGITREKVHGILHAARLKADEAIRAEMAEYAVEIARRLAMQIGLRTAPPLLKVDMKSAWDSVTMDTPAELKRMLPGIMLTPVEYLQRGQTSVVTTEWYAHACSHDVLLAALEKANTSGLPIRLYRDPQQMQRPGDEAA